VPPGPTQEGELPKQHSGPQEAGAQQRYTLNSRLLKAGITPPLVGGPTKFEKRIAGNKAYAGLLSPKTGQVVGYERRWRDQGTWRYALYGRDGTVAYGTTTGEDGLEADDADPTDIALMINPVAVGGALVEKAATSAAKKAAAAAEKALVKKSTTAVEKAVVKKAATAAEKAVGKRAAITAGEALSKETITAAEETGGKRAADAVRSMIDNNAAEAGENAIAKEGGRLAGKETGVVLGDLARRLELTPEVWQRFLEAFGSQGQAEAGLKKIVELMGGVEETRPVLDRFREVGHLQGAEGWLKNLAAGGEKLVGTRGEMNVAKRLLDHGIEIERVSCRFEGKEAGDILTSKYAIDVKTLNLSEEYLKHPPFIQERYLDFEQVQRYARLYPDKATVYIFEGVTTEGVPPALREALSRRGVTVLGELSPLTSLP